MITNTSDMIENNYFLILDFCKTESVSVVSNYIINTPNNIHNRDSFIKLSLLSH